MIRKILTLASLCVISAQALAAGTVTYWAVGADNKPTISYTDGVIVSWEWGRDVVVQDYDTRIEAKIPRDRVISIARTDDERGNSLRNALAEGTARALQAVEAGAREPALDREEAFYEAAALLGTAEAMRNYLTKFPKGYYALDVSLVLAGSLATSSPAEADKVLTEAANLGGNRPKARANFQLALLKHGRNDKAGATAAFQAAAEAAKPSFEFDIEIQSHYNLGELALAGEDAAGAKAACETALTVSTLYFKDSFSRTVRGKCFWLLGRLAKNQGDSKEAYAKLLRASYWLSASTSEPELLVDLLTIAEAAVATDAEFWTPRAKAIRETLQRGFANTLREYDDAKRAKADGPGR